jgi:hypothetical protein
VAQVQPAALVHDLQELPDVLDVGVGERVVVGAPVHPLAKPDRAGGQLGRRPPHDLAALGGERLKSVLLDLALGVQTEFALNPDLDPQSLAVEAVLVALVEPTHRLVALEDILERAPPCGVHAQHLVRRDRPVDETEPRPARVPGPELAEDVLGSPELEDRALQRVGVRLVGQAREHVPEPTVPASQILNELSSVEQAAQPSSRTGLSRRALMVPGGQNCQFYAGSMPRCGQ